MSERRDGGDGRAHTRERRTGGAETTTHRGKGGGTWHGGEAGEAGGGEVDTKWSTRVGMRLRWWIENAKGGDASGPMSEGAGWRTRHAH